MDFKNNNNLNINNIPELPGCYIFKKDEHILYIGKAKNIKKRILQYFNKAHSQRLHNLIDISTNIETIITNNEKEALILEHNLIKEHTPKYNILLKDDKKYPYIFIPKEKYPRLIYVRNISKKKGKYFGPFPDGTSALEIVDLLNRIFPFRKCNPILPKVCLYYHLGQCMGPCEYSVDESIYEEMIKEVESLLSGKNLKIIKKIEDQMNKAAKDLKFEIAADHKNNLTKLKKFIDSQIVDFIDNNNIDFIAIYSKNNIISIVVFFYRSGKLLSKIEKIFLNESINKTKEIIEMFLYNFYQSNKIPDQIIIENKYISEPLKLLFPSINFISPKAGKKREILDLCYKNCENYYNQNHEGILLKNKKDNQLELSLKKLFKTSSEAPIIQVIDISHIQGESCVGGIIEFKGIHKNPKKFRKYKIENKILKANDPLFIKKVLKKHFIRTKNIPDVLIVDGGKPQVNAASFIKNELKLDIKIFGLVKDSHHETSHIIDENGNTIVINKKSDIFYFLSLLQDTVHKFAISFFRSRHSKKMLKSGFENIPGVGPKTTNILRNYYNSLDELANANYEELSNIINKSIAKKIIKFVKEYYYK